MRSSDAQPESEFFSLWKSSFTNMKVDEIWRKTVESYRLLCTEHGFEHKGFICRAKFRGTVDESFLFELIGDVNTKAGNADFGIILLIRLLYLTEVSSETKKLISDTLSRYGIIKSH